MKFVKSQTRAFVTLLLLVLVSYLWFHFTYISGTDNYIYCHTLITMVLGTVIRYSVPLSFVYCTIYQQNIWREGDEKLVMEQKRVWRDFFGLLDCGWYHMASRLSKDPNSISRLNLVSKFDSLDVKSCWNSKVNCAFSTVDKTLNSKSFDLSSLTKSITSIGGGGKQ